VGDLGRGGGCLVLLLLLFAAALANYDVNALLAKNIPLPKKEICQPKQDFFTEFLVEVS